MQEVILSLIDLCVRLASGPSFADEAALFDTMEVILDTIALCRFRFDKQHVKAPQGLEHLASILARTDLTVAEQLVRFFRSRE